MERVDNSKPLLKNFLEIPYDRLEEMNLAAASKAEGKNPEALEEKYREYLTKEKGIKAITVCFTDIEGKLHMLDFDKKHLLNSADNLTFDGSSIRGFSRLHESDLRLEVDWPTIRYLPSDIFGSGKVIMFGNVLNREKDMAKGGFSTYESDFRGQLKLYTKKLKEEKGLTAYAAAEIEGFLVKGVYAEQKYKETDGFELISSGGYFQSLPMSSLRQFIDKSAEAQRAMGFRNEKDHPEVAPSQFEMNFAYTEAVRACDQIQLYKLVCRQVANLDGMTATFLPKPIAGINGSGMHTNFSLSKNGKNIFHDLKGRDGLSSLAWDFINKILNHAPEICLVFNSSVNAYRRLDPNFEAPNQIKVSPIDRGSMIRIPVGNEKTARIEIRSVAPDANPYAAIYTILRTGLEGKNLEKTEDKRKRLRFLPDNINDAIRLFKSSDFVSQIFERKNKEKFMFYKQAVADRSPKELGKLIKASEIIYHHEVTNQLLWNNF